MPRRTRTLALALATLPLLTCTVRAQPATPPRTAGLLDQSPYLGQPVNNPEALSGLWEAPDGAGGTIGIHLILGTTLNADTIPRHWLPQSWSNLTAGVYQRQGDELRIGQENFFADSPRGGNLTLAAGKLHVHSSPAFAGALAIDLDLEQQPGDCWHGLFHRGDFSSTVSLCRPDSTRNHSLLVGTWLQVGSGSGQCVHVASTGPATFTGWSDTIERPGRLLFPTGSPRPHTLYQQFGGMVTVHLVDGGVTFELGARSAICCAHLFAGKLSSNGHIISTFVAATPTQREHTDTWRKMPGNTCVPTLPNGLLPEPTR